MVAGMGKLRVQFPGLFEADLDVQDAAECVYCLETRTHSCLFPLLD